MTDNYLLKLKLCNIAYIIKEYRVKVVRMSSENFAIACGVSKRTISKIETGKNFNIISLIKVIEESGIKKHQLAENLSKSLLL